MNMQANADWTEAQADAFAQNMLELWTSGGTLAQTMDITPQECEALYAYGHGLYAQGKYEDAFKIFARLVAYDHLESRYQMALASAMQMTRRYEEALEHYMIATVMSVDDPVPVYHCAECLIALGRITEARESLTLIVDDMCQPGEHDEIQARAQALLTLLQAQPAGA